jgi:hypothetical protein
MRGCGSQAFTTRALPPAGQAPRLLRTGPYELVEPNKVDLNASAYAILSHTWRLENDEITFADMVVQKLQSSMAHEAFNKIRLTCDQATREGLEYIWVDTCCIDKSSSADLSEAIDSMYAYYARAKVCYVFMSDVELADGHEGFRRSRWFTRAWTLQELLAPIEVRFYDKRWMFLGRLSDPRCANIICEITGVDGNMLLGKASLKDFSIAQRMPWAAHRYAKRLEDRAYSLLGIFGVNMPMIYGEGDKAFVRLQENIIRKTTDHSILCWNPPQGRDTGSLHFQPRSLFASSPSYFAYSKNIVQRATHSPRPFNMTNRGLGITLPVHAYFDKHGDEGYTQAKMNCVYQGQEAQPIVLNLQRQYDLDADHADGFQPWASRSRRARREAWDYMMGRPFDWQFVASYARRAFLVGHSSQGSRIKAARDEPFNYREQTIVILRDSSQDENVGHTRPQTTANPLAKFIAWIAIVMLLGSPILISLVVLVLSIVDDLGSLILRKNRKDPQLQKSILEHILVQTEQAIEEQLLRGITEPCSS